MNILPGVWKVERRPVLVPPTKAHDGGVETILELTFGVPGHPQSMVLLTVADAQKLATELILEVHDIEPARWNHA